MTFANGCTAENANKFRVWAARLCNRPASAFTCCTRALRLQRVQERDQPPPHLPPRCPSQPPERLLCKGHCGVGRGTASLVAPSTTSTCSVSVRSSQRDTCRPHKRVRECRGGTSLGSCPANRHCKIRVRPDQCAACSRSSDYMDETSREASAILCAHAADGSDRSWCGVPSREGTGAVRTHSSSPHLNAMCTAPGPGGHVSVNQTRTGVPT